MYWCVFVGEMSESRQKKVRIKEIDGWTLGMLIDYVYTAEIQVTEENVQVTHTRCEGRVDIVLSEWWIEKLIRCKATD